jgi:hypothetical protein
MSNRLEYIPAPPKPEWFDARMLEIGGRAPNGDLRYRAVWGMDEKEFFAGREDTKYCSFAPGQVGMPRWIIERWIPPTLFSPLEWREHPELGPYPSRGVYILMFVVNDPDTGDYAPLDEMTVNRVRHDHMYLVNQRLEAEVFAKQAARREAMRKKRDEYIEAETLDNWKEYFSREDYYNAAKEHSFASKINPAKNLAPAPAGETCTPSGIITPKGVSVN